MASKRPFSEEDISCPVCRDIFRDPVLLLCSHTACKACLQQFWVTKGARECPVCRKRSQTKEPPLILILKNLCESFLEDRQQRQRAEAICNVHSEHLTLFCRDDEQPVCAACKESEKHTHHSVCAITEAASACKKQTEQTEKQIKEDFEKLRGFLQEEEAARLAALRNEERQKLQLLVRKTDKQDKEISSLSQMIQSIQKDMAADNISFLRDPERVSGALINVAKHLGNLKFRVWEKMQEIVQYTLVILDPNTAHPGLVLSNDLTSLRRGDRRPLPENPGRLWNTVLGSEGFNGGTHCWDVEVRDSTKWALGVMTESARRKGSPMNEGVWMLFHLHQQYGAGYCAGESVHIIMKQKPQRIRVQLDWDRGELSFSDPDNNTHLHTVTHTFTERVFPFFSQACKLVPMKVLPVRTSASVEQCRAITGEACLRAELELLSPHSDTAAAQTMTTDAEVELLSSHLDTAAAQTMTTDADADAELLSPHSDTAAAQTMTTDADADAELLSPHSDTAAAQTMTTDADAELLSPHSDTAAAQTVTTDGDAEGSQSSCQTSAGEPSLNG
ncbi:E3 ubiquitin-protein ligase TRIM35-like [Alosa pseudoharengus]|uniref:E3 ubiquitin-protein ligase TRIM35-like n=1 Tax=Alosa pseudoharengus TaxID=34774 RepID=UPI003F8AE44E